MIVFNGEHSLRTKYDGPCIDSINIKFSKPLSHKYDFSIAIINAPKVVPIVSHNLLLKTLGFYSCFNSMLIMSV